MIYFKELAHTIVEAGASASSRAGQQAGSSGGFLCYSLEAEFLWMRTDWMRASNIIEGNLYLMLADHKC